MFKNIRLENIIPQKSSVGIELFIQPDGSYLINAVLLKKKKSSIVTVTKITGEKDFSFLNDEPAIKKHPLVIVLNGKGILHKKVRCTENDNSTTLLSKVLPNANQEDFNIQSSIIDEGNSIVSVIRQKTVNEIISELKKHSLVDIQEIFLGVSTINLILPLINTEFLKDSTLPLLNYDLKIVENKIADITISENTNETIVVGDEKLEMNSFVAFSAALSYFVPQEKGIIDSIAVEEVKNEFKEKLKYQVVFRTFLVSTLIVLLASTYFNTYYSDKSNEISSELGKNYIAISKYERLKKELDEKTFFLESNGLLKSSNTSYYADNLASDLPATILWTDFNINPIKKKDFNDTSNVILFEKNKIIISGKFQQSTDLNDWMKTLKQKEFVKSASIVNFKQENSNVQGVFLIEVILK